MRFKMIVATLALAVLAVNVAKADTPEEEKQRFARQHNKRFRICTSCSPLPRKAIHNAAGYAVFKNFGTEFCWW